MDINAAQSYAAQVYSQKTYGARTDGEGEPKTSSAETTASTTHPQTNDNAVTGTTGSRLSAETDGYLIHESQEDAPSQGDGTLNDIEKRFLTSIANNPEHAARMSRGGGYADARRGPIPKLSMIRTDSYSGFIKQRRALSESEIKQGIPSAEIYQHILEFNAKLPQGYGDSLDQTGQTPPGAWNKHQQAMADYLKQAIVQSDSRSTKAAVALPSAYQHQVEDIASDPKFAAIQAKEWATFPVLIAYQIPPGVPHHSGPGAASPAENAAFEKYVVKPSMEGSRQRTVDAVQDKLKAAYQDNMAQGKSGAETYLNLLEIQVSQPQEYWKAIDPDSSAPKQIAQGKLDLLRQLMAQDKPNSTDVTG